MNCSQCGAVGAEHYTYKTKAGPKPFSRCKNCHNEGKYAKKGTGWARLPDETKDIVRTMLADRRNKIADVAKATGIPAVNLGRWIATGSMATDMSVATN